MTSISRRFGVAAGDLVAAVGAGGKSSIVAALGKELAAAGLRTVVTTTTRMAERQATAPSSFADDPAHLELAFEEGRPLFVARAVHAGKVMGFTPAEIDRLAADDRIQATVVEADGARRRLIKAPGGHEPAIPSTSTVVIVVGSLDAIGRRIEAVAHRPERVAALLGRKVGDQLSAADVATILTHERGGRASIPPSSRVVIALVAPSAEAAVHGPSVVSAIRDHPGVDTVAVLSPDDLGWAGPLR